LTIQDAAIWKIAELMAYAMAVNLFLTGVEAFKEFYAGGQHVVYTQYYFVGLGEHKTLVPSEAAVSAGTAGARNPARRGR
jgi:molybdopterin-containing oxidoreductase family membrane subunit